MNLIIIIAQSANSVLLGETDLSEVKQDDFLGFFIDDWNIEIFDEIVFWAGKIVVFPSQLDIMEEEETWFFVGFDGEWDFSDDILVDGVIEVAEPHFVGFIGGVYDERFLFGS